MAEPGTFVKIPRNRIGVLIGPNASTKALIENELDVRLDVNSESGDVGIKLKANAPNPAVLFRAKEVVLAVGRGFSPEKARRLIDEQDSMLIIVDLRNFVGKSESDIKRISGRIIGREGKTRKLIEELTETYVSVCGHTVSIIGFMEEVEIARQAIEMFIRGRLHTSVYRFLHAKRREIKKRKLELWKKPYE
ncbi:MAG: KH domain-containing protein [Candidatus Bathyarchaeota archaeon]|jgi:ribosomal RNA assembly protein|nr:KH domain-containing protein [Candidatus Bathyarchaeota archaeon]